MRKSILAVLVSIAVAREGSAACTAAAPVFIRELPQSQYASARSIAWRDDARLLIGTRGHGIVEYDLAGGRGRTLVGGGDPPTGMPDVEKLDTDGKTLVAFNRDRTDVAADLATGNILHTRREARMRIIDIAVRKGRTAVLGYYFQPDEGPRTSLIWLGGIGTPWTKYELLYDAGPKLGEYFKFAYAPHGGAVRFLDDETIAFVTPGQPGVFRYRIDGRALPTLGKDMTELVVRDLPELMTKYNLDVRGRYERIVNRGPAVDDLVTTAGTPSVVVRRWSGGKVWWELWSPSENAPTRKLRLGIEDARIAGGHLRCAARGRKLACIFGKQTQPDHPDQPHLVLFDLSQPPKPCK